MLSIRRVINIRRKRRMLARQKQQGKEGVDACLEEDLPPTPAEEESGLPTLLMLAAAMAFLIVLGLISPEIKRPAWMLSGFLFCVFVFVCLRRLCFGKEDEEESAAASDAGSAAATRNNSKRRSKKRPEQQQMDQFGSSGTVGGVGAASSACDVVITVVQEEIPPMMAGPGVGPLGPGVRPLGPETVPMAPGVPMGPGMPLGPGVGPMGPRMVPMGPGGPMAPGMLPMVTPPSALPIQAQLPYMGPGAL